MDETVEVPDSVRVRCPLLQFKLIKAGRCAPCPHFRGLADRFPGPGTKPFSVRYSVICAAEPVKRELFEITDD